MFQVKPFITKLEENHSDKTAKSTVNISSSAQQRETKLQL
jgi:hypothetical protein